VNLLRRLASMPGLRVVLLHPAVRGRIAAVLALRFAVAARRTTTPVRLLLNEYLLRRGQTESYRIRSTGVAVGMQHGRDLEALFELFERGDYEPPAAIAGRLAPAKVHRILDVGANVGMFSAWATGRWPDAEITAFEPSGESIPIYRTWAATGTRATLIEAGAGPAEGTMEFREGLGAGSRQAAAGDTGLSVIVPVVDVLPHLSDCDFAKIDIEGGEWAILADDRLADLHGLTLVMEYHRYRAPSLPAVDAARTLLERAGFTVGFEARNHWGHGTLWAWKD
jgi:FkbM family methyltransferase